jgi:DNA-binding NtrC family response regulator
MKRISVLLVDDDALVLSSLRRVLQAISVHVRTALSAEAALVLFEEQIPEMVISDLRMPGMDGVALLAEIQRRCPWVRCALHTGEPPEITRGLAWPILHKPCSSHELVALLRTSFRRNGRYLL